MKRIKNFYDYINEKAVTADEVISNEPDTALVKISTKKPTKEYLKLILFNFKTKIVEGYLAMERYSSDEEFMIQRVFALDKHGPLMYELALSAIAPKAIIPDRTIRPAAQKVWTFFDKNRPDVKKTVLDKKHEWFAKEFDIDIEHEHLKTPEVLDVINKAYSINKPLKGFDELLKKGETMMKENRLKPKDLIDQADKDFAKIYDETGDKL